MELDGSTENGQNDRLSMNPKKYPATAPYPASIATSALPRTGGSSPANIPTQAQPNIWYGIHGPTPPVSSAEANSEVQPSANPNPAPNTRPARTRMKNTVSMPAVPAPSGRSAALIADSRPSMASALASMPPSAISANTTASTSASSAPNISGGGSVEENVPGATTNGHRNATNPRNEAMAIAAVDRGRTRIALRIGVVQTVMG